MKVIDVDIGEIFIVDGHQWITLDRTTDGTLSISQNVIKSMKMCESWKGSAIRKFLNTEFSKSINSDKIWNTRLDDKVILLTEMQLKFYKDFIPECSENWWLMPEHTYFPAATMINELINGNNKMTIGVRPVVTFKRWVNVDEDDLIEETPAMYLASGMQLKYNGQEMTALQKVKDGFICIFNQPIGSSVYSSSSSDWETSKAKKMIAEKIGNYQKFALRSFKPDTQSLNQDVIQAAKETTAALLDFKAFQKYSSYIRKQEKSWFLLTPVSASGAQNMLCVDKYNNINTAAYDEELLIVPVIILANETIVKRFKQ